MSSFSCNNTLKKTDHLMKTIDKNQKGKSLPMITMQLKVKNNLLLNTLIIEIEIKDFYGLKISKINLIQIYLFNLKTSMTTKATGA
jgi:uncharacterized protein YehS (DUF1456 family)